MVSGPFSGGSFLFLKRLLHILHGLFVFFPLPFLILHKTQCFFIDVLFGMVKVQGFFHYSLPAFK